ncbi:hypothetical protein Tco_0312641 [Tanacetum coccineum]
MDGRGVGSCVMLGLAPSGPSFSISPSVKLSVAGRGGARKGGSCVIISDLVVMAKVDASGFGHEVGELVLKLASDSLFRAILPFSFTFAVPPWIKSLRAEVRSTRKKWSRNRETSLSHVVTKVGGILSSHSASFPLRRKWRNLNLDVSLVAPSACMLSTILKCRVLGGVDGLGPVLLDEEASSSKRFLSAIARDSF